MADVKVSALSDVTAPAATDALYIVQDPTGSPSQGRVGIDNVVANSQFLRQLNGFRLTTESGVVE
jgi:hypothetical protein